MNFLKEIIYQQPSNVLLSPFYAWAEIYNVTGKPHQFLICVLFSGVFFSLTLLGICFWPKFKKLKIFKKSLMVGETINRDKPKYLFVEHGILNDRSGEIYNGHKQESIFRILRLDMVTQVFKAAIERLWKSVHW